MPTAPRHSAPGLPADTPGPLAGTARMRRLDWLLAALFAVSLFLLCWLRPHGILWNDEVMGWTVLDQPTWHDLLRAWNAGVDSSGILFYVFTRPWLQLFGWNELSLHLASTLLVALSAVLTWIAARRFAPTAIVALVIPLVYLANRVVVLQISNGRAYGLLLTAAALAAYALLRTDPAEPDFGRLAPALLSFAAFLLLAGSHVLGMLFWGVFLAGFLLRDLLKRVVLRQWKIYLGALLALALIVPFSLKNIHADLDMGKPTFWTAAPTPYDLLLGCGDFSLFVTLLLSAALVTFCVLYFSRPAATRAPLVPPQSVSLYCLLAVFPALTLGMYVLSVLSKSIFIDRYLLPVSIGDCLLLAELLTRSLQLRPLPRSVLRPLVAALTLVLLALFAFNIRRAGPPKSDYTAQLVSLAPGKVPIVITDTSMFIETIHYRDRERTLLTPTDWSVQLDPGFGGGGASFLHEMEDWRSVGIYAGHILPTAQLLAENPRFLLISDPAHSLWFRRYIGANPLYHWTELPRFDGDRVWSVERVER